jgi:hypothetical protein
MTKADLIAGRTAVGKRGAKIAFYGLLFITVTGPLWIHVCLRMDEMTPFLGSGLLGAAAVIVLILFARFLARLLKHHGLVCPSCELEFIGKKFDSVLAAGKCPKCQSIIIRDP